MLAHFPVAYIFAIGANLCFGTASIVFSKFAISHGARFINQLKVSVALICFLIAFLIFENYIPLGFSGNAYLFTSGLLGLCIGDLFLFRAFAKLGPARTLVLYTFQPFLLATYGYFFLDQILSFYQVVAIACMISCVFTFVLERNQTHGKLDLGAFSAAFIGILFDAIGVMLTRQAYEGHPTLGSFQANLTRALGACLGFLFVNPRSYQALFRTVQDFWPKERLQAIGASVLGTFISLSLYLYALKSAHVATLTAISITLPIWVSLIEHIRLKSWPNRYLWAAFGLFLTGFVFMNL